MTRLVPGLLGGIAAMAIMTMSGTMTDLRSTNGNFFGNAAWAQGAGQHGKDGGSGAMQKGPRDGTGQGGSGGVGKGGGVEGKVLRGMGEPDEDSDRPDWAGVKGGKTGGGGRPPGAGSKKGDLYGDLYFIVRDENGEPVIVDGYPQVYAYVQDASGNLVPLVVDGNPVVIPRDAEGELQTTVTVGDTTYTVFPSEVEFGRTSVARSPERVLIKSLDDTLAILNADGATVTIDPVTGRIVVNGDEIDSPLANLALYTELLNPDVLSNTESTDVLLASGVNPAALLAAASDKGGTLSVDYVVYENTILGINPTTGGTTTYYDFSTFDYDRTATWSSVTATVLVLKDGVYVPTEVNIYDTLFGSTAWSDPTSGGADDFAQAADDYLKVITYIHDNSVPTN